MKEATINAKQAGERGISAKSVKKVTEASIEWVRFLGRCWLMYWVDITREVQRLKSESDGQGYIIPNWIE